MDWPKKCSEWKLEKKNQKPKTTTTKKQMLHWPKFVVSKEFIVGCKFSRSGKYPGDKGLLFINDLECQCWLPLATAREQLGFNNRKMQGRAGTSAASELITHSMFALASGSGVLMLNPWGWEHPVLFLMQSCVFFRNRRLWRSQSCPTPGPNPCSSPLQKGEPTMPWICLPSAPVPAEQSKTSCVSGK